jgi:hypothetical protein
MRLLDYAAKLSILYTQAHHLYKAGKIDGAYRDEERRIWVPQSTVERDAAKVARGVRHGLPPYTALTIEVEL